LTTKGYLALAPAGAQLQDSIALFKGGKCPLVIRQRDSEWSLVGDSFVHGIMYGEAWDEDLCAEMILV